MADCLGLMLETVSRQMSALQNDRIIVLDGKRRVQMPDCRRLMMETGDDADGGVVSRPGITPAESHRPPQCAMINGNFAVSSMSRVAPPRIASRNRE